MSPYGHSREACGPNIPKNCTTQGLLCETCSSLVDCIKTSDNPPTYTKTPIATCPTNEKCSVDTCTTAQDVFCDGTACLPFPCQDVGIYPDPFYCDYFVLCVRESPIKLTAFLNKCEAGYAFDIGTSLCTKELGSAGCSQDPVDFPVPFCNTLGQSGAIAAKPYLYYICEEYSTANRVLYPVLYKCPGSGIFQGNSCVTVAPTVGPTTTVPTTVATTAPPTPPPTTPPLPPM